MARRRSSGCVALISILFMRTPVQRTGYAPARGFTLDARDDGCGTVSRNALDCTGNPRRFSGGALTVQRWRVRCGGGWRSGSVCRATLAAPGPRITRPGCRPGRACRAIAGEGPRGTVGEGGQVRQGCMAATGGAGSRFGAVTSGAGGPHGASGALDLFGASPWMAKRGSSGRRSSTLGRAAPAHLGIRPRQGARVLHPLLWTCLRGLRPCHTTPRDAADCPRKLR